MSPRNTFSDIIHERTDFDFVGRSWRWLVLSGTVIVLCLVSLTVRGLNLGIDFEGGTSWQFEVSGKSPSVGDVRETLRPLGLADAKVQTLGGDSVRVQAEDLPPDEQQQVTEALADYGGIPPDEVSVSTVGPTWGDQVSEKAVRALIVFLVVLGAYLSLRLDWKMAVAMIIAMLHDVVVAVGVYSITGFEVAPATVVAFLTILGFSLYDSVVVFDKVKENSSALGTVRGDTYSRMVNRSMNQVLMRSLNTSLTAVLPVLSLLVVGSGLFGAVALRDFALALLVGILTGAYSSIFVAVPIVAWWKEREPRYRALRERSATAAARPVSARAEPEPEPAIAAMPGPRPSAPAERAPAPSAPAKTTPAGSRAPRPRQQRRRKRR